MNNKPIILLTAIALAASITALLLIFLPATANPSDSSYNTPWTDNFDSSTLNNRWSWVREDPSNWSLTARPGYMRIATQPENLTFDRDSQKNLFLTPQIDGDFRITTRLSFTPTENYHQAGLIVYQDDDNYLKFHRVYDHGNWVGFLYELDGSPDVYGVEVTATLLSLQITKQGNAYSAQYSLNGADWTPTGVYTITLTNPRVGLEVSDDYAATSIPADFDFFTLEDNGIQVFLPMLIR